MDAGNVPHADNVRNNKAERLVLELVKLAKDVDSSRFFVKRPRHSTLCRSNLFSTCHV